MLSIQIGCRYGLHIDKIREEYVQYCMQQDRDATCLNPIINKDVGGYINAYIIVACLHLLSCCIYTTALDHICLFFVVDHASALRYSARGLAEFDI